jgi:hypothetical protein
MVGNPTFLLDQMGDTMGGPQSGLVAQRFWTALESLLDLAEILRPQAWLRPARPAFFSPARPFSRNSAAH